MKINFSKVVLVTVAALTLAGCSPKKAEISHSKPKKSSTRVTVVNKKVGHLKSNNLSPQQTVSIVVTYAGKKYPAKWGTALKNAQNSGLKVNLKNQSEYSYMNDGSGVAYMITDSLGYTLKQEGTTNQIYLFADNKELASVSIAQMANYLNHHDGEQVVKKLAGTAQINDDRNEGSDSANNSANSKNQKSNVQGDAGLVDVPADLQGTWYGYPEDSNKMDVVKFDQHNISYNGKVSELHKIDGKFFEHHDWFKMPKSYKNATKNWGMTYISKPVHGITWLNLRSWMQGAGDGEYYGIYREQDQQVMIGAHGAGMWADTVYWQTPALAKQYKGKKFSNLDYGD